MGSANSTECSQSPPKEVIDELNREGEKYEVSQQDEDSYICDESLSNSLVDDEMYICSVSGNSEDLQDWFLVQTKSTDSIEDLNNSTDSQQQQKKTLQIIDKQSVPSGFWNSVSSSLFGSSEQDPAQKSVKSAREEALEQQIKELKIQINLLNLKWDHLSGSPIPSRSVTMSTSPSNANAGFLNQQFAQQSNGSPVIIQRIVQVPNQCEQQFIDTNNINNVPVQYVTNTPSAVSQPISIPISVGANDQIPQPQQETFIQNPQTTESEPTSMPIVQPTPPLTIPQSNQEEVENTQINQNETEKIAAQETITPESDIPPPPPAITGPLPPPPPPLNAKDLGKPKKVEKKLDEAAIENKLRELIAASDVVPSNQQICFTHFHKKFLNIPRGMEILNNLVEDYHFVVKKYPLAPEICFKTMFLWEKELFLTLNLTEKEKKQLLKSKWYQIANTDINNKPELQKQFDLIKKDVANKRKKQQEEQAKLLQGSRQSSVIDELKNLHQARQKNDLEAQKESELANMQHDEIDLTESAFFADLLG